MTAGSRECRSCENPFSHQQRSQSPKRKRRAVVRSPRRLPAPRSVANCPSQGGPALALRALIAPCRFGHGPLFLVGVCLCLLLAACSSENAAPSAPTADAVNVIEIKTNTGVAIVLLPGGTFAMGSDKGKPDEGPRHEVSVSAFAIDKFEVTQAEFAALEIPNPSAFQGEDRPVEQMRWSDAAMFCNERSKAEGLEPCYDEATFACNFEATGYRLPTEAEWEYACRAGADGDYGIAGEPRKLRAYACYSVNARKKTDPVGQKKPNAWGLHDMLGNVAEWCYDVYGETYYQNGPATDPRGPAEGKKRVLRGGGWSTDVKGCRVSARIADVPGITDACFARNTYGFRCVRRLSPAEVGRLGVPSVASARPEQ